MFHFCIAYFSPISERGGVRGGEVGGEEVIIKGSVCVHVCMYRYMYMCVCVCEWVYVLCRGRGLRKLQSLQPTYNVAPEIISSISYKQAYT